MATPIKSTAGREAPNSPEQEEAELLASITAGLDGGEEKRYQSVDEFAPEFLLGLDAACLWRRDDPR
jgi:hypothetical protein